ncbi:hypothetical protein BDV96DRAFT_503716, partial [Lophiotrema nucula]
RSRSFWINAICIDQMNDIERAQQVQQMGLIFSNPMLVIYWRRAWITQEIALAKSLVLMAGAEILPLKSLPPAPFKLTDASRL